MTDKEKIRTEVQRLKNELEVSSVAYPAINVLSHLQSFIDSMQEEHLVDTQIKKQNQIIAMHNEALNSMEHNRCSIKHKFKVGDTVRRIGIKEKITIHSIEEDGYVVFLRTGWAKIFFKEQNQWELVEEPVSIWHDASEETPTQGSNILMVRKEEKDTNYPPIAGCFHGTNSRLDGRNWGYYNGFCYNEIEAPYKWAYVDDFLALEEIPPKFPIISSKEELKQKHFKVEKGKWYVCIKDYHDKNCTFTKGKNYKSDKDGFLVDDEDKDTFERKIWEEDACEYFRPIKCMYTKDNFTDEDRKILCEDCEEKCEYSKKEEPVSEELKVELEKYIKDHFTIDTEQLDRFGIEEKDYMYSMDKSDMLALVEHFTNWQKTKEEPVSEELEEASKKWLIPQLDKSYANYGEGMMMELTHFDGYAMLDAIEFGAKWQKLQDMGITNKAQDVVDDVLSSADSPLDAYATEVAFIMLPANLTENYHQTNRARISDAVRLGAKWQKEKEYTCYEEAFEDGAKWKVENLLKPADGDDLPEIDREVVVFTQIFPDDAGIMSVSIAHRPDPNGWDGKSLATGKVEHYTPQTYDKGGWNIPNIVYWLDVELPKEIEL